MNPYAYTPIPDGPITLDLTGCKDWLEMHQRICRTFGLPSFCGKNWDALWDLLRDAIEYDEERLIMIRGIETVPERMRKDVEIVRDIFGDLQVECPLVRVEYC